MNRKQDILNYIDNMSIQKKDYDIIFYLLENIQPSLFSIILERVKDGDLYWSDFDRIFSDDYGKILEENLYVQKQILNELKIFFSEKNIDLDEIIDYNSGKNIKNNIALSINSDIYNREKQNFINDSVYKLTSFSPNDSDISLILKIKLMSLLEKNTSDESLIDNIFLFTEKLMIPIKDEYQILTEKDKIFMKENNLSEEEMKHIKSLTLYLKQ